MFSRRAPGGAPDSQGREALVLSVSVRRHFEEGGGGLDASQFPHKVDGELGLSFLSLYFIMVKRG